MESEMKGTQGETADAPLESTQLTEIEIGRTQRKLIYRCLGRIKKSSETACWTVALERCCYHYLAVHPGLLAAPKPIPTPTGDPTPPFRYRPHADQKEIIDLALGRAKEAIGIDDDGAALAHICLIFMLTDNPDPGGTLT